MKFLWLSILTVAVELANGFLCTEGYSLIMCMTQYFQGNAVFCLQQLSAQPVITILLWNRTTADFYFYF